MTITIGLDKPSFLINSSDRISGSNESFDYIVDLDDTGNNYDQVAVTSVTIPKSYYNLSFDSVLVLSEDGVSVNIPFERGDYNLASLKVITVQKLNLLSPNGYVYTMTSPDPSIEVDTRKFTFTCNAPVTTIITLNAVGNTRLHHFLGFIEGVSNTFVDVSGVLTLTSVRTYNFEHTKYIIIKSNISHNAGNLDSDTEILVRVPITNPNQRIIHYRLISLEDEIKTLYDPNKNNFHFALYDDENRLLDLNGDEWSMTLFVARHNYHDEIEINHIKVENIEKLI
jgi:hypothetical protein